MKSASPLLCVKWRITAVKNRVSVSFIGYMKKTVLTSDSILVALHKEAWSCETFRKNEASTNLVKTNRTEPSSTYLFISLMRKQAEPPFRVQGSRILDILQEIRFFWIRSLHWCLQKRIDTTRWHRTVTKLLRLLPHKWIQR